MQWVQQTKRQLATLARRGMDLVYPPQCACCHAELDVAEQETDLCEECQKQLIPRIWTPCPRCGGSVEGTITSVAGCVFCSQTPFHFDSVVALGSYHTDLKQIILRMKRPFHERLAIAMGNILATQRREMLTNPFPEVVIPIPMYWMQRILREVNSPEIIACSMGKVLEIPFRSWVLVKSKKTMTQSELPQKQRFNNVRGAFRVRFAHLIRGRHVLLVDDVLTTGATCNEAAYVLKQAGAKRVTVAVVARTHGQTQ
jgi:ComF family protein